jgi:acetyltransferase-like isoleucine patch superfamily enzyme
LRKDHRPYAVKKGYLRLQKLYARHFLKPQFDRVGSGAFFIKPWHVEVFGGPVTLGDHVTIIATADRKVRLSVWSDRPGRGAIRVGDCSLLCPGVRISSAAAVSIGSSCMLASGVYITDGDWHGIYDRVSIGRAQPVSLAQNVWVGDSAIVCKGVAIGANSIIGAGSVVVGDIPANAIAAGNPARVVKLLDPAAALTTRADWYADPARLARDFELLDRANLARNTFGHWLRTLLLPLRGD